MCFLSNIFGNVLLACTSCITILSLSHTCSNPLSIFFFPSMEVCFLCFYVCGRSIVNYVYIFFVSKEEEFNYNFCDNKNHTTPNQNSRVYRTRCFVFKLSENLSVTLCMHPLGNFFPFGKCPN